MVSHREGIKSLLEVVDNAPRAKQAAAQRCGGFGHNAKDKYCCICLFTKAEGSQAAGVESGEWRFQKLWLNVACAAPSAPSADGEQDEEQAQQCICS